MTEFVAYQWNNADKRQSIKHVAPPSPELSQDDLVSGLAVLDNISPNSSTILLCDSPKVNNKLETEDIVYKMSTEIIHLVYWKIPGRSGIVLGGILSILILTRYYSLLYVSAAILTIMTGFNLIFVNAYTSIQAIWSGLPIQQSQHPYQAQIRSHQYHLISRDLLEYYVDKTLNVLEAFIQEAAVIVLVKDSRRTSIAFGISFLTYLISGLIPTKVVVGLFIVGLFTVPYCYDQHQEKVDRYLLLLQQKSKTTVYKYGTLVRRHSSSVYDQTLVMRASVNATVQQQISQLRSVTRRTSSTDTSDNEASLLKEVDHSDLNIQKSI